MEWARTLEPQVLWYGDWCYGEYGVRPLRRTYVGTCADCGQEALLTHRLLGERTEGGLTRLGELCAICAEGYFEI